MAGRLNGNRRDATCGKTGAKTICEILFLVRLPKSGSDVWVDRERDGGIEVTVVTPARSDLLGLASEPCSLSFHFGTGFFWEKTRHAVIIPFIISPLDGDKIQSRRTPPNHEDPSWAAPFTPETLVQIFSKLSSDCSLLFALLLRLHHRGDGNPRVDTDRSLAALLRTVGVRGTPPTKGDSPALQELDELWPRLTESLQCGAQIFLACCPQSAAPPPSHRPDTPVSPSGDDDAEVAAVMATRGAAADTTPAGGQLLSIPEEDAAPLSASTTGTGDCVCGWLWAGGCGLAVGWLWAGCGLAVGLWAGCGLAVGWLWAGCGLAVGWLWAGCGLAVGWLWAVWAGWLAGCLPPSPPPSPGDIPLVVSRSPASSTNTLTRPAAPAPRHFPDPLRPGRRDYHALAAPPVAHPPGEPHDSRQPFLGTLRGLQQ
ncbi:hypothetical protein PAPYR_10008 [Paratrimastix pyriformis]|uniref:Uncharacterized protein n=1 Tax=Paratrimastix pyriformis TaxID=342808 RepID=A0ABQ8UCJ6_9EUKA|nr:hypothetical protein PAPYR_10008 [Paratrimastix pyriformis]